MNLNDIVELQREFDERHGWNPDRTNCKEVIEFMGRDIIGLMGEIGEFANVIKKIQLERSPEDIANAFTKHKPHLEEEIVDTLIYVMRLACELEVDLEKSYREKLAFNAERFKRFEVKRG